MYMVMIGVHRDFKNNIIGFRILDDDNGKFMDVSYEDVKRVLIQSENNEEYKIENLKYEDGEISDLMVRLDRFQHL